MKFNSAQQAFIDSLINKRVAEVRTAAEAKAAEAVATAQTPPEFKRLLAEAHDKLRLAELKAAAASHGAINPGQVAALLDSSVKIEDGKPYVVNAEGARRFSKDGAALPIDAAVAAFLTANPNHVKGSVTTGAGSQGNNGFFSGITRVIKRWQFDKMAPEEKMERILDGATVVD